MTFKTAPALPLPEVRKGRFLYSSGTIEAFSDEGLFRHTGVRIAFTTRHGGVSAAPYDSLNLASHVNDELASVEANRARLLESVAGGPYPLIVPNQVHGHHAVVLDTAEQVERVKAEAQKGADAVCIATEQVAALLCFADCVPVIAVLPTGSFAVIHAGWRGVDNHIAADTIAAFAMRESQMHGIDAARLIGGANVYLGPYIHAECFEVGQEARDALVSSCGESCEVDPTHIDLGVALANQLTEAGVSAERICDVGYCTVCNNDEFYSYRAQGGICGRQGAFAIRLGRGED